MQEHHPFPLPEPALAAIVDQPRRTLARIDRVEENAFEFGEHPDRLDRVFARDTVARADIIGIGDHILALDHAGTPKLFSRLQRKVEHVLFLLRLGRAHPEPQKRNARIDRPQPHDQPGLGARAARCRHHMVNHQPPVIRLANQFKGAVHIAKRPGCIRTASDDCIDLPAVLAKLFGDGFHFQVHIQPARPFFGRCAMQMIKQHIAVAVVVRVVRPGAILQQDMAFHAQLRGEGRGLARVVRLRCALGHHDIGAHRLGLGHQEFQLAGLVAPG